MTERLQSYRHFVRSLSGLAQGRADLAANGPADPSVRVRIRGTGTAAGSELERIGPLTPYELETITEDARRAGRGAVVDVQLQGNRSNAAVAQVRQAFAPLARLGVRVHVARPSGSSWRL